MKNIKSIILLILTMLFALPASSQTQDSNSRRILYEQNFESVSNVEETGWKFGGQSISIVSDAGGKYLELSLGQNNGRSGQVTWGNNIYLNDAGESILTEDTYRVNFDFCIKQGSNNQYNSEVTVFTNHTPIQNQPYRNPWTPTGCWQNYLFDMSQVYNESMMYAINGGTIQNENEDGSVNYSIDYNNPSILEDGIWYTVSLDVNVNNRTVDYSVKSLEGVILKQGQLIVPLYNVNGESISMYAEGLYLMLARYQTIYNIDNIIISTERPSFEYNGIWYTVIDLTAMTCKTMDSGNKYSGDLIIPGLVSFGKDEFHVVEIGKEGFSDSFDLYSISLPSTIEKVDSAAFSGCERLTSVIWRGDRKMPSGIVESIDNPNLLVYVGDKQYAPEGLDHNVVANGICESLVLTSGYPFTPVADFTAKTSSMKKEFLQTTAVDGCAGWETLVLPFDATRVTSPEGHALRPFAAVSDVNRQRPFWLYEADQAGEWQESAGIKAGVPYIISMPNNPRYNPAYNIHGTVTFSNPNPQKITTETTMPYVATWTSGREFRSLWLPLDEKQATDAMGLNVGIDNLTDDNGTILPPGSAFHTGITPKPLEAYVVGKDNAKAFRIHGLQSAVLTLPEEDGLKIAQEGSIMMLKSSEDRTVEVYSADGTMLRRLELKAGEPVFVDDLPQGVCLIAGRKIMIR